MRIRRLDHVPITMPAGTWRTVRKTVYTGSIPVVASSLPIEKPLKSDWLKAACRRFTTIGPCAGRVHHSGVVAPCGKWRCHRARA
jgi:hypothetical protein